MGHIILNGTVFRDFTKVEGVLQWPPLTSMKELRGFLSLSEYYRRFVSRYGVIVKPLTTLLKKDVLWSLTEQEQAAFEQLKKAVTQTPVLVLPNFKEEFCVETDACG